MLLFSRPLERLPTWGEIDPSLLVRLTPLDTVGSFDILMGNITGSMGAVHILVLTVSGVCLMFRRTISPTVTVPALAVNLLLAGVVFGQSGAFHSTLVVLVSGSFLFVLLFLVNDPQTLPKTFLGRVYYGLLFGGAATVFRHFSIVEGYPVFALLIVNTMNERSDILARQTTGVIRRVYSYAKNKLDSFERFADKVENEFDTPLLTTHAVVAVMRDDIDTELQYNMPPIDNKIIKINRKKPNLIARIREKLRRMTEKQTSGGDTSSENNRINFFHNLKAGLKDLRGTFRKRDTAPESLLSECDVEVKELTVLDLELIIDENDVIEVEARK
jgi:electron transport complex protein RnfD